LLQDVDGALDGHRAARYLRGKRSPDEVLHDEIELALLRLADVVDVDDVSVVDAVRGARFPEHPGAEMRLAAQVRPDQLDRDDAVDEHVPGAVDDAHPALADARFEAVTPGDYLVQRWVIRAPARDLRLLGNCVDHLTCFRRRVSRAET